MSSFQKEHPNSQLSSNQSDRISNTYRSSLQFSEFDWTKDNQYLQKKPLKPIIEITKDMKPIGKKVVSTQSKPDYLKTKQECQNGQVEEQSNQQIKKVFHNGKTFQRIFGEDTQSSKKQGIKKIQNEELNFQQLIGGYPKEKEQPKKQEVQNINNQFQTLQKKFAEGITFIAKKKLEKTPQHHFANLKGYEMISDIFHTGFNQPSQVTAYKIKDDCVLPIKGKFKERRLKSQNPKDRKRELLSCTYQFETPSEVNQLTARNE